MSAMGRPEREYRSAQREGNPVSFDLFDRNDAVRSEGWRRVGGWRWRRK